MANPNGPNPNDPPPSETPPSGTPPPAPPRYNTTPNWQDPFHPPSPGDPYWAEWIAANPTYRGQGYTGPTPTPTPPPTTTTTTPPPRTTLTYDAVIAHANATAGTAWGRGLTAADIDRMKAALGFDPNAALDNSVLDKVDNWINANHPPRAGPPGPPTFDTPPPGGPPGSYGGAPPTYKTPEPFVAGTFTGPTAADLMADPSMKFRFDQGLQATQGQAASRGLLNTGNTLKDLLAYGQDFGSQEYKNVWDRSMGAFAANEAGRFGAYNTNVQNQNVLPYMNAADMFKNQQQSQQGAGNFNYNAAYNTWVQQYNMWRSNQQDWWQHATQVT